MAAPVRQAASRRADHDLAGHPPPDAAPSPVTGDPAVEEVHRRSEQKSLKASYNTRPSTRPSGSVPRCTFLDYRRTSAQGLPSPRGSSRTCGIWIRAAITGAVRGLCGAEAMLRLLHLRSRRLGHLLAMPPGTERSSCAAAPDRPPGRSAPSCTRSSRSEPCATTLSCSRFPRKGSRGSRYSSHNRWGADLRGRTTRRLLLLAHSAQQQASRSATARCRGQDPRRGDAGTGAERGVKDPRCTRTPKRWAPRGVTRQHSRAQTSWEQQVGLNDRKVAIQASAWHSRPCDEGSNADPSIIQRRGVVVGHCRG